MTRRKYKIGEAVIWTDYTDGTRHQTSILAHIEPDPDDDYDEAAHGPLYLVTLRGSESQVAEEDLSPWPRPSPSAAPRPVASDQPPGESGEAGGHSHQEGQAMSDHTVSESGRTRDLVVHVATGEPEQALTDDRIRGRR